MQNKIVYDHLLDFDKIEYVYYVIRKNTRNKNKLFNFEMFYLCNIFSIFSSLSMV